jgi:hypothetical protein
MDRAVVKGMVEDYWRAIIPAMQNGGKALVDEIGGRFEDRIEQTAALLSPVEAAAFLQMVEADRTQLISEYQSNPVGLKNRLGLALGVDGPATGQSGRQGLGELAVRTAVRATVWEMIWSLFRR